MLDSESFTDKFMCNLPDNSKMSYSSRFADEQTVVSEVTWLAKRHGADV